SSSDCPWCYCLSEVSPASRSISWGSQRVLCWLLSGSFSSSSRTDGNPNRDEVSSLGKPAHATRGSVAKTSLFLEHLVSGCDNGRDGLIKAQSALRLQGKKDGKSRTIPERFQGS